VGYLSSTPFVYSNLQRAFWQGFSNTAATCVATVLFNFAQADLLGVISPQHFDDMPTIRPSGFRDPWAFELSLRRGGCCGVDPPGAYSLCKAWVTRRLLWPIFGR
jgi:hypothetical protein